MRNFKSSGELPPKRWRRSRCRSHGIAAVEMAVVCPVLLVLAFATTDFGRIIHADLAVANASRRGAEYGSTHTMTTANQPDWEARIREVVNDELSRIPTAASTPADISISTTVDSDGLPRVAVEVEYSFQTVVAWPGLSSSKTLHHRVEMRRSR